MRFDYDSLHKADKNNEQVGNWGNWPVYAMSKHSLRQKAKTGVYYVVYDDDNVIVTKRQLGSFVAKGRVMENGNVYEFDKEYTLPKELNKPKEINMEDRRKYTFNEKTKEVKVKEEKVEFNLDEYLKEMNSISVEDMLVGVRGADAEYKI